MDRFCSFVSNPSTCDWAVTGSMLSGVGQVASAVTVVAAAWIAANTFNAWKRQHLTQKRVEYAEQIITLVRKAEVELDKIRHFNPERLWHEREAIEKDVLAYEDFSEIEDEEERRHRIEDAVEGRLYLHNLEENSSIEALLLELLAPATAYWGEELSEPLEAVVEAYQQCRSAANTLKWFGRQKMEDDTVYLGHRKVTTRRDAMYQSFEWLRHEEGVNDSAFAKHLSHAIKGIKSVCENELRDSGTKRRLKRRDFFG